MVYPCMLNTSQIFLVCLSDNSNKLNFMVHSTSLLYTLKSVTYKCLAKPDVTAVPPHFGQPGTGGSCPTTLLGPPPHQDILNRVLKNQVLQSDLPWTFYSYTQVCVCVFLCMYGGMPCCGFRRVIYLFLLEETLPRNVQVCQK